RPSRSSRRPAAPRRAVWPLPPAAGAPAPPGTRGAPPPRPAPRGRTRPSARSTPRRPACGRTDRPYDRAIPQAPEGCAGTTAGRRAGSPSRPHPRVRGEQGLHRVRLLGALVLAVADHAGEAKGDPGRVPRGALEAVVGDLHDEFGAHRHDVSA